jgi:hypothetical protein
MSSPLGATKLKNRLIVREKLNIYGFFKKFKQCHTEPLAVQNRGGSVLSGEYDEAHDGVQPKLHGYPL